MLQIFTGGMATIHKLGENVMQLGNLRLNWEFYAIGKVYRKKIRKNPVALKFQTTNFSHAQYWYLKVSLDTKVLTI